MTGPREAIRQPVQGEVFEAVYPFVRDTYNRIDGEDECGLIATDVPTWKPGVRHEDADGQGNVESVADAMGRVVLTVVSVHKPGRFPVRVFFTRTWVDPDGKPFGKTKCRMTTVGAFRALARGYRHRFVLLGCNCDGCDWPYSDHRLNGHTQTQEAMA